MIVVGFVPLLVEVQVLLLEVVGVFLDLMLLIEAVSVPLFAGLRVLLEVVVLVLYPRLVTEVGLALLYLEVEL